MLDESGKLQRSIVRIGQGAIAPVHLDISEQVAPVVLVGPDGPPYAGGYASYATGGSLTANAGNTGTITLENPEALNATMLVEEVFFLNAAAGVAQMSCGIDKISVYTTPPNFISRPVDRRGGVGNLTNLLIDGAFNAGISSFGTLQVPGQQLVTLPWKNIILQSGEALGVQPVALAATFAVAFRYRVIDATTK